MKEIMFKFYDKVSKKMFNPMPIMKIMDGWGTSGTDLVPLQYIRAFGWDAETREALMIDLKGDELEVIGNIYETPELLA